MHEVIGRASSPDDATTCGQAWGEEEEEEEEEEENTAQPGPRSSTTTQVGDEPSTSIHPLVEVYKYQVAGPRMAFLCIKAWKEDARHAMSQENTEHFLNVFEELVHKQSAHHCF